MSIPNFSEWPDIPQRSAPEADFDAKMYALFQHLSVTHRNEFIALVDWIVNNVAQIGDQLDGVAIGQNVPSSGRFTNLLADSLGGGAVQSSPNDTEEGKIMKTKAFGHGLVASENPELTVDMDDAAMPTGATIYAGGTTLNKPDGRNGAGMAWRGWGGLGAAGELHQLFGARRIAGSRPDLYYRSIDIDGGWGEWVRMLHPGNIVGLVYPPAASPIGAVIERGSNANGEYVRFADGTQICRATVLLPYTGSAATLQLDWAYPAAFDARPVIIVSPMDFRDGGAPAGANWSGGEMINTYTRVTGSTSAMLYASKGAPWVSGDGVAVHALAVGRWF